MLGQILTMVYIIAMGMIAFDTFAAVTRLKEAGFTEAQAKGFVDTFQSIDMPETAMKADIKDLRSETEVFRQETKAEFKVVRGEIRELELRINARFEKLIGEMTLLKWMMGLMIAGILSLVLKAYFPH